MKLLSPQQWSAQGPVDQKGQYKRYKTTSGNATILHFPGGCKTITHDAKLGLPIMYTLEDIKPFTNYTTMQHLLPCEARFQRTHFDFLEHSRISVKALTPNHVPQFVEDPLQPLTKIT